MNIELDVYAGLKERVAEGREVLGRPLTWAEKVLMAHLRAPGQVPERGRSYVDLDPDRVALQDALAQIVALQFMTAGLDEVVVPTTIHCDHLITARTGAAADLTAARARTRRSTSSCVPSPRSTGSASGSPDPGSSTRLCSRTSPSPAE